MNQLNKREKGFTLIELMLAMTFLSMLLLAIALTIVQIATIYNRGLTAKDLNASSRALTTEFTSALTSSNSFALDATHYIQTPQGGRLCVGSYSYVWNYANALSPAGPAYPNPTPDPARNIYDPAKPSTLSENIVKIGSATRYEISLVKVSDSNGSYCVKGAGGYPKVNPALATELLRTGDYGIVLYDLEVASASGATDALSGQQLYKITFVLGTPDTNAMTLPTGQTFCKAPGVTGSDTNYCSVEVFTLVVRVVNGVN